MEFNFHKRNSTNPFDIFDSFFEDQDYSTFQVMNIIF